MRYQRNAYKRSRAEGFAHPRPTTHTAESYRTKYLIGGNANTNRLFRHCRLLRREAWLKSAGLLDKE